MWGHFSTYKKFSRMSQTLRPLVVLSVIMALIAAGGLTWLDNSRAYIPFGHPGVKLELTAVIGPGLGSADDNLYEAGKRPDSHPGALLVRGNGGLDDNREQSFQIRLSAGELGVDSPPAPVSGFAERRTVRAYKDFGHLRVMPAAELFVRSIKYILKHRASRSLRSGHVFYKAADMLIDSIFGQPP